MPSEDAAEDAIGGAPSVPRPSIGAVFTIPGLGFTPEVFSRLDVGQPVQHLSWLEPDRQESLGDYARRMSDGMKTELGERVTLIGHSFGGILAQEIARHRSVDRILLVSSMKARSEIPLTMRAIAPLGIHRLFNRQMTLATFSAWGPLFGYSTKDERAAFRSMVSEQSNATLQWQLRELSRWNGARLQGTELRAFHGDKDKTLPFKRILEPVHRIQGGGHMMIFSRHEELNPLLAACL